MAPEFPWELNYVIALAMLCGYESVIKGVGKTEFCSVLQPDDFRDFGVSAAEMDAEPQS
jgi:hypothetical protein